MNTLEDLLAQQQEFNDSQGTRGRALTATELETAGIRVAGTDLLAGRELFECWLGGLDLRRCDLRSTDFWYAGLEACRLDEADCTAGGFVKARLGGASLRRTRLAGARFARADLSRVDARGARFTGAVFRSTDLSRGDFREADFSCADLSLVDFSGCDLSGARFEQAHGCLARPWLAHPSWNGDLVELLLDGGARVWLSDDDKAAPREDPGAGPV